VLAALAVLLAGCGSSHKSQPTTTSRSSAPAAAPPQPGAGRIGPEGVTLELGPPLGSASTTAPGNPVDGIQCAPVEQLAYHIHVHLQVFADGQPRYLPPGIGMVGPVAQETANGLFYGAHQCYYWLHVHAGDGIIHIESPTQTIYTLGEFFDEWGQPLSPTRVANVSGPVTALVNGKPWRSSPRAIPLRPHAVIQLDVGKPLAPFRRMSWAGLTL